MRIIDNVEGTVLGIQLFQRKVVLDAYDAWIGVHHPRGWIFEGVFEVVAVIGFVMWLRYDTYGADIVALTSCLILLITQWYYSRQYNKQAPSELKRV